jgi:diguanylate cyclase (GGDEF)-like protein
VFRHNLFVKTFSTIVFGVISLSTIYYVSSVPMIGRMAFQIEERAGLAFLDNMFELVRQSHRDMEAWRNSALLAHKRELKDITQLVESYIADMQREVQLGRRGRAEAQKEVIERVRQLTYGHNDYVWISDYRSVLISHPDPKLHGADFSGVRDVKGNLIVPPMVEGARRDQEGFYSYWWRRLGEEKPVEKLTYYRNVPAWKWVVGTGVYVDDIEEQVAVRRRELIEDLRRHLHTTPISGSGYMFVFDANKHMIIHPSPALEDSDISGLLDPQTGKPLADELIEASHRPDGKFEYLWDKPSDPGHYVYAKISWVRHFEGTDWYIASSVYREDLETSAHALTRRILATTGLGLMLAIGGGYFFVRTFTTPIKQLAESANRIRRGELATTTQIHREDEIGVLAEAFNNMVEQLKDQIRTLEDRVNERTAELSARAGDLEQRNRDIESLNAMGDLLQACRDIPEAFEVVAKTVHSLYPASSGAILVLDASRRLLERTTAWGAESDRVPIAHDVDECWGMRRGKAHLCRGRELDPVCGHVDAARLDGRVSLCVPMLAQGEYLGVLYLETNRSDGQGDGARTILADRGRLAETVAEQAALVIANMRLRESLHSQSIRDPLTGLFNRRHLDEVLVREQHRAERQRSTAGVVMLDVDHFKRLNDSFGHEAGDLVLRELGKELWRRFRRDDSACRFGGEEFVLVLPMATLEDSVARAEELRAAVAQELRLSWRGEILSVTVSIGVGVYPLHGDSLAQVLEVADRALYRAKSLGRNRVEVGEQG